MRFIAPLLALALAACASVGQARTPPHLRAQGEAMQLIVDGEPFLILGGELGNSTASSLDYLRPHWERFEALNMNTLLAPVSWELIEPREGQFDFSSVDGLLRDARRHDMRLVILWFGSWKNSMSSYAPAWVKRDQARFPRARDGDGRAQEILSPFYAANWEADARAFAALMAHLGRTDTQRSVIMVQVENEIGMLPSARDHSEAANAAWSAHLPADLATGLAQIPADMRRPREMRAAGWPDVFGADAAGEEAFMAWYFARYTERVTAAGKAAYDIPMFVNAALPRPGAAPGRQYPSAGPLPHLFDLWRAGAPSIDFLAPDIYFPNLVEWMGAFRTPSNPLFVPEANRAGRAESGADAFYVIGAHDALGYSPFSIEDTEPDDPLGDAYSVLAQLAPILHAQQGRGLIAGVRAPVAFDGSINETPQRIVLGDYAFTVTVIDPWTPRDQQTTASHGGLIIQLASDEYLIAGSGITVTFAQAAGDDIVGIESAWEGEFVDGVWRPGRLLNGDQTHQGRHVRLPPDEWGIQRVRLYRYS